MKINNALQIVTLAETDAIWFPERTWDRPRPINTQMAQRAFATLGVRFRPDALATTRQKAFRALDEAAHRGVVSVAKTDGLKWVHIRLTDAGEREARAMACLPWFDTVQPLLARLANEGLPDEEEPLRDWIPETALCQGDATGKPHASGWALSAELSELEIVLMPAFARGYIESRATVGRHVYFRLTKSGRAFATTPLGDAGQPDRTPRAFDDVYDARELYLEHRDMAYRRLDAPLNRNLREIGELPLPVSMPWRWGCERPPVKPATKSKTRRNAS